MNKIERVFHPWWKWECFKAGFFDGNCELSEEQALNAYKVFLEDLGQFEAGIKKVFNTWPHSCEQFLSNTSMNRVAWLGQAAACAMLGIPSKYRAGYKLMSEANQAAADALAQKYITQWEVDRELYEKDQAIRLEMEKTRISG